MIERSLRSLVARLPYLAVSLLKRQKYIDGNKHGFKIPRVHLRRSVILDDIRGEAVQMTGEHGKPPVKLSLPLEYQQDIFNELRWVLLGQIES